jgi:PAS domain S-box-containing protein
MTQTKLDSGCGECRSGDGTVTDWLQRECAVRGQILREVAKISARFISAPVDDIDDGILNALAITGQLAGVDRSYVFLFDHAAQTMTNTHEWCADGIPPQRHELQHVQFSEFPWVLGTIRSGQILHVPKVSDVPDEAAGERAVFESGRIQSLLCVPLIFRDDVIGFVGFDSVCQEKVWSEDDASLLRIVGDVLASAINQKRVRAALHESEQKWRVLAENSADIIMIIDRDFRLRFVNHLIPGFTLDDVLGTNICGYLDGDEATRALDCFQRVLTTGRPDGYSCTYRDPAGVMRKFDSRIGAITADGEIVALSISATDITERVQTRDALEESEVRLRQMAEHIDSVFWLFDIGTSQVLYISPSFKRIFGMPCEDLIADQRCWRRRVHPDDRPEVERQIDEGAEAGAYDIEYRLQFPDGTIRWIRDRAFPVYNSAGQLYRLAGFAEDITEHRRAEEDLSRARRLESAGQVAGQIAHDFNNLLAPMVAYPDLIRSRIDAPAPVVAMLHDLEVAATQMAEINQQLLTLGRRGHYNVEPVDLGALTDQVIRTMDLPESIDIHRNFGADIPSPLAGRAQLARVFANLIRNAVEAMDGQGCLTFRTEICPIHEQPCEWEARRDGQCVVWSITDTGPGISEDALDRIFDPYFSTKQSDLRRGSGLGLAVAHSVVRDHAGYITVKSEPGRGTTFHVFLHGSHRFTNEVQHQIMVLPWDNITNKSALKNAVRLPVYTPRGARSGKSRQLWIARHQALLGN